jgi:hypothetical protein
MYLTWAVRACALRAPFFEFTSNGALRAPRPSMLRRFLFIRPKLKINYVLSGIRTRAARVNGFPEINASRQARTRAAAPGAYIFPLKPSRL